MQNSASVYQLEPINKPHLYNYSKLIIKITILLHKCVSFPHSQLSLCIFVLVIIKEIGKDTTRLINVHPYTLIVYIMYRDIGSHFTLTKVLSMPELSIASEYIDKISNKLCV